MGISERWTSVGLGTRGVSLGTDASPRTTRADARVAVASAAVAVSSSFIFFFSPSLRSFQVLSSRFLCPISIYPFPRVSTYRGSETRRFAPSSSRRKIVTLFLLLLFLCITSSRQPVPMLVSFVGNYKRSLIRWTYSLAIDVLSVICLRKVTCYACLVRCFSSNVMIFPRRLMIHRTFIHDNVQFVHLESIYIQGILVRPNLLM